MVSRIWLSTVSTTSSKIAWVADGTSDSRRVTRIPPTTSTNMITQVDATAEVTDTGPSWKSGMLLSGEVMALSLELCPWQRNARSSHQLTASVTAAHLPGSLTSADRQEE